MRYLCLLLVIPLMLQWGCESGNAQTTAEKKARPEYALVIHGGAGAIKKSKMTPELEKAYRAALETALQAGETILKEGGAAQDAVIAAIQSMEENPLFNSGKGAVLTNQGKAELDASFMDGKSRNSGAVAGVRTIKSPIAAARLVMDSSKHVMMSGEGAEIFAKSYGLEMVENDYFITEKRKSQLARILEGQMASQAGMKKKYGTVGCAALDKEGNLAAGTSTGGMMNKRYGRVGDAPIIGAGTYADNASCAVSCTGHGEYFIRNVVAYDVAARMSYLEESLEKAANYIIMDKLKAINASGGLIAVDKDGNIAMPFNSSGMYRGYAKSTGERFIGIYHDEE
ncbi:MAG: isoaspartyl peptidase/L-asparaginase [Bacteroidia bacterium]|nr:isoaspartyl peptidase/L-asparaginase [Bacteroidia bacterium]